MPSRAKARAKEKANPFRETATPAVNGVTNEPSAPRTWSAGLVGRRAIALRSAQTNPPKVRVRGARRDMEVVRGTPIREEAKDAEVAKARATLGPLKTIGGKRRKRNQTDLASTFAPWKQMVLGRCYRKGPPTSARPCGYCRDDNRS